VKSGLLAVRRALPLIALLVVTAILIRRFLPAVQKARENEVDWKVGQ
jgi:hypothetical protein